MKITITAEQHGKSVKEIIKKYKLSTRLLARLKTLDDGICVNGVRCTVRHIVSENDVLTLRLEDTEKSENIKPFCAPVQILWEDEHYLAAAKPSNIPTHPARHHQSDTLASRLAYLYSDKNFVFRALTRLDLDTSGVVIIAKDQFSANEFSKLLIKRQVKKEYLAVCRGIFEHDQGLIDKPIYRPDTKSIIRAVSDTGDEALTEYKVIARSETATLVQFSPITGRTHQIRVHTDFLGHPIIGDTLYSVPSPAISRQALHAHRITFLHPFTKEEVTVECPLFDDMLECINTLFGDIKCF